MKIVRMQIKNFLSLSDVEILPGKVNQIIGGNNNGKTSIIKALEFALKGGTDGSLVRHGENEAEIIVEFDDEMTVRRRLKSDGKQTVQVKKGQFAASSPQTILDGLLQDGSFNPLTLLDSKKRTEIILSAIPLKVTESELKEVAGSCPVDLPPLDYNQHGLKVAQQAHKYFYQRRAEANKDAKAKEETARVKRAELPEIPKANDTRTVDEIRGENEALKSQIAVEQEKDKEVEAQKRRTEIAQAYVTQLERNKAKISADIQHLEKQLSNARAQLEVVSHDLDGALKSLAETKAAEAASGADASKIADLNSEIQSNLSEINLRSSIQTIKERHDHVATLEQIAEKARSFAASLDKAVENLGAPFRTKLIESAKLPVQGLSFENDEFLLDGCNIDNLSASKAISLAIAVARSVAGPARLICIDGAEALDEATYAALRKEIEDDGFQYFITKVGEQFMPVAYGDAVVKMNAGNASIGA